MPDRERLGRYKIVRELGRGGMGVVYQAEDEMLGRTVALKTLMVADTARDSLRERLMREARLSARLDHPHVIRLHDVGSEDGLDFLVLEFVEGRTLRDVLGSSGRMRSSEALQVFRDIVDGVAHAQDLGIVHRDLKPENVMVTPQGRAKVMDFGIAWQANQARLTQTGGMLGTLAYFSPEQARGQAVDGRSDLYSLGAILFELLTGELVFEAQSAVEMITHHLQTPPRRASSLVPGIPPELDAMVTRCLQKDPSQRYPSARAMLEVLEPMLREPFARHRAESSPATPSSPVAVPAATTAVSAPPIPSSTGQWGPFQRAMAKMQDGQVIGSSTGGRSTSQPMAVTSGVPRPAAPDSFDTAYRRGKMALESGQFDVAVIQLQDATRLNPKDPRPHRHLASLHARQNRLPEAIEACRTGLKLAPDHARLHGQLGDLLVLSNDVAGAAGEYEAAVKLRPDLVEFWRSLARLYVTAGRVNDALRAYEAVAASNSRDPDMLKALPALYMRQSKPDRAEAAARRAFKYLPRDASVLVDLARALDAQRQPIPAAQTLEEAIKLDPDSVVAWEDLTRLHVRAGRPMAAQAILEQALARHPHVPELQWLLGEMDVREGRASQAVDRFERALSMAPAVVAALKRIESAADEADLKRRIATGTQDVSLRIQLARLYLRTGRERAASDTLQEALIMAPNELLVHYLAGQARRLQKQMDGAVRSFERAWKLL